MPRPSPPLRLPTSGGSLASLGDANSCVLSPSLAAFSLPRASALSLFAPGFMAQRGTTTTNSLVEEDLFVLRMSGHPS